MVLIHTTYVGSGNDDRTNDNNHGITGTVAVIDRWLDSKHL